MLRCELDVMDYAVTMETVALDEIDLEMWDSIKEDNIVDDVIINHHTIAESLQDFGYIIHIDNKNYDSYVLYADENDDIHIVENVLTTLCNIITYSQTLKRTVAANDYEQFIIQY